MDSLREQLTHAWDDELYGLPGRFSIDLRAMGARVAARDADAIHYAASTIKLAVLMALLSDRTAAVPEAQGRVLVHADFASQVGGRFQLQQQDDQDDATWAHVGDELDILDLADRMITVSSNIATDLIVERIGVESVRAYLTESGLRDLRLDRLIGDAEAQCAGVTNSVTAAGLADLMVRIASASDADSATALELLARQTHRDMIPAGLPHDVWSASKGGWVTGVKHDVALVEPRDAPAYVLAVCTTSDLPDAEGTDLVARLSAITWEHWNQWHAS